MPGTNSEWLGKTWTNEKQTVLRREQGFTEKHSIVCAEHESGKVVGEG